MLKPHLVREPLVRWVDLGRFAAPLLAACASAADWTRAFVLPVDYWITYVRARLGTLRNTLGPLERALAAAREPAQSAFSFLSGTWQVAQDERNEEK